MKYAVVIRSGGKNPEFLKKTLEDVRAQTIPPERVIVYLPEGTEAPDFRVGNEEYQWTQQGMMAQRILPYEDIDTPYILMLDDDLELPVDSVQKLFTAMAENDADCIGVDTFYAHKRSMGYKLYCIVTNFVFPHRSDWAFKVKNNGSFSYKSRPKKDYYPSQSCAGNLMLWKKSVYKDLQLENEKWLDVLPFAYGDDLLETYKVYRNGYKLGVLFNSDIKHNYEREPGDAIHKKKDFFRLRGFAQLCVWWRICYRPGDTTRLKKMMAATSFSLKIFWLFMMFAGVSVIKLNPTLATGYVKGLREGLKFVRSEKFKNLPPYVFNK